MVQRTRMNVVDRLARASALLARQQHERAAWGGNEEFQELSEENRVLADQVLPVVEQALDEDLYAQLDREEGWRSWFDWPPPPPFPPNFDPGAYFSYFMQGPRRRAGGAQAVRSTDPLLDRIISDFASRMNGLVRRARMEGRTVDAAELDPELQDLREDLRFFLDRHARSRDVQADAAGREPRAARRGRRDAVRNAGPESSRTS